MIFLVTFLVDEASLILDRKYANGGVGSFTHVVALQGINYSCEMEVYADGYQLK